MTPVLNEFDDEIVLLPVENPEVAAQLKSIEGFDLKVIEGRDYNDLAEKLELPELTGNEARDYFVAKCNEAAGYGTPVLADVGYEYVYGLLRDSGDSLQSMIDNLSRVIMTWHQADAEHVLGECDVDFDDMPDDEKVSAAIDAIMENDFMSYETTYDINGETLILYSAS